MSVTVSPITTSGAPPVPTSFSDTFIRTSGLLGRQWFVGIYSLTPTVAPVAGSTFGIGVSTLDGVQCCIISNVSDGANPNTQWKTLALPQRVYNSQYAKNQFAQATFVQNTGAGANQMLSGLAVLGNADDGSCYFLRCAGVSNLLSILRNNGGVQTNLGDFGTVANGDIVRLSCVINAGSVDLTATKNGVFQITINDPAAGRITTGSTGIFSVGAGGAAPGRAEFRNFSCGLGA